MDNVPEDVAQLIAEAHALRLRNAELEAVHQEQQRMAKALQMSEARFRLMVEQSPLSTQIFAPDGRTVQVNRAWEKLWGVTLDKVRDYNVLRDPQLVAKGVMPYIQRGFRGEAVAIPPIMYDPDATLPDRTSNPDPIRQVRAYIYPVHDGSGKLREVVLIHEDITEQARAEEALRTSEARYRALFEHFPNGSVFLFDRDLRYTLASGTGLAATSLSPEMFEGKTLWEIFSPEVAARDEPYLRAALRGEASRVEVPFDGKTFVVRTMPVRDSEGAVVGGMVMTQDVTERKRAEERIAFLADASAILGSSLDYQMALENVARLAVPLLGDVCHVLLADADGRYCRIGAPAPAGCVPLDLPEEHPVAIALRTGEASIGAAPAAGEGVLDETGYGDLLPATYAIVPLASRGQTLGALILGRNALGSEYDPKDLHVAQEAGRRAAIAVDHARLYHEAQEALRVRDEVVSIAAHELRTPLTTLLGSAELLNHRAGQTESYTLTDRDRRMLRVIEQQGRRLQQLIDGLLGLSHLEDALPSLHLQEIALCSLVERMVGDIQPTLTRHQVTFSCADAPVRVRGDEARLEQALQNLLQNAVKYSPAGGEIIVHVSRRGAEACVAVTDQGIGIPAEAQAQLFERFYRARNAAASGVRGMGIGLAVVADIVARHGGHVEVSSVEGQGSTFTICLPAL